MRHSLLLLTLSFLLFGKSLTAQTKLIAHKSHSGSAANFSKALNKNLFNIGESNFGMAPQRHVRNSNLDTVKLLSPTVAVMVTSESCYWEDYGGGDRSNGQLWSAGTDTVYDHPVFNRKNTVQDIKKKLKQEYFFQNPVDSIVFIGFDGNYATAQSKPDAQEQKELTDRQESHAYNKHGKRRPYFLIIILSILSSIFSRPL